MRWFFQVALLVAVAAPAIAEDRAPTGQPRPIPLTRPEMKQYLEDMKGRTPRIPLPELTEEEKANLGERGGGYESRVRALYGGRNDSNRGPSNTGATNASQPSANQAGANQAGGRGGFGFGRYNDPKMTLDYRFKTSLFWIVSRTNNCQYCLGHQESKLLSTGMTEDEIAALDGDWSEFGPAEQAAFALARKLTLEPHRLTDADIERTRKHYTDLQILEMILSVAGNNSLNRWKEGVGVPQSRDGGNFGRRTRTGEPVASTPAALAAEAAHQSYLTPTSEKWQKKVSLVAPIHFDAAGKPTRQTVLARNVVLSRSEVEEALARAAKRTPRLPLVEEAEAREILAEDAPQGALPQWMRLLANFPVSGKRQVSSIRSADETGDLSPLLKAQISWIVARQDQAWYAAGQAKRRLVELGQSEDQVYALDGDWSEFPPREKSLFTVARNLAASPVVLTDDEVATALKAAGPREVVQTITYTTNRASFDRITEAAGLQIEP
jgi:alkylhydroperoxidase family enzyme